VLEERHFSTRYVWLRYNHYLTKIVLAYARVAGYTRYEMVNGVRVGCHDFRRSAALSWLFVAVTFVDAVVTSLLLVYIPCIFRNQVTICDRWILDILVDLEVDTGIRLDNTVVGRWFLGLLPVDAKCFLIERAREEVSQARAENRADKNFSLRLSIYERYSSQLWVTVIDNNRTVSDAVSRIIAMLDEGQAESEPPAGRTPSG